MNDGKAGFAHRLNAALDQLEIPPKQRGRFTALAKLFSVSPTAARDWCEGKSYPSVDKLLLIMDTVRCDADWLLFGRGVDASVPAHPALRDEDTLPSMPPAARTSSTRFAAPHAGARSPTAGAMSASDMEWISVRGDSMSPTLRPGDQVCIECWQGEILTDGIYALRAPGDTGGSKASGEAVPLFRRVLRCLDGQLELSCDNPLYQERPRFTEQPTGRLLGLARRSDILAVWGRVVQRTHFLA